MDRQGLKMDNSLRDRFRVQLYRKGSDGQLQAYEAIGCEDRGEAEEKALARTMDGAAGAVAYEVAPVAGLGTWGIRILAAFGDVPHNSEGLGT
jgi:hypothetical protein